ncbi:hypothetical protein Moror_2264, partial [Moniliophthora roreri MCA 2997]
MLKAVDMVYSGEQRKYLLAVLHVLLEAIEDEQEMLNEKPLVEGLMLRDPEGVSCGYNLACQLIKTGLKSPLHAAALQDRLIMLI